MTHPINPIVMPMLALRRLQPAALLATLVLSAACEPTSAPAPLSDPVASVTIHQDTVVATAKYYDRDIRWMTFPLDVSITNKGAQPFGLFICASSVEQRVGDEWQKAWSPTCAAIASEIPQLLPGETLRRTINVDAALQGPAAPVWKGSTETGSIRFLWGIVPRGMQAGTIPWVPSNEVTFRLESK